MQCCVPFCVNTSDNASTSARTGISFNELPSEENLRAAWLRALGTQDHHLPDPAVVCSQHFVDEDFYETKSCVRQIRSNAIPTTVQMCMICLDTDSKLSLMSKHKLEEAYEQLTGLSLCRGGNLKQTLCVLCAQRLINFSRFRDFCLRAHSLMTDLLAQHKLITIQHKELMNCTTKHLKFNLTQITLVNHCDLYVDHTDEEEQTAAEESVVGVVASIVPKKEDISDSMSNSDYSELTHKDDNLIDNACVSNNNYSNTSIKLEPYSLDEGASIHESLHAKAGAACTTVTEHVPETENFIKIESVTFGCTFCHEEFMQENEYYEHMSEHLQYAVGDDACDASRVCEPRAAVSRSGDALVLQNKTGSRRLYDVPPPAADYAQALVAPLSARLAANNDHTVQATEEAAATRKTEQILETDIGELDNQSSQSDTKIYTDINRFTNTGEKLCERVKTADKTRQGSFVRHLKTHTGELRYSCDICHYKCAQKNNLVRHLRTHTGEKPYCCEICNFKCSDKSALSLHILTHTGEKPFCCEICNYRCAHKGDLTKHKITHTGEKPYSCEKCSYKSAQKSYLKRHQRTHTNEKPFSCEICNYKCKMKSELNRHERTHTGEKPFCCETCNHRFANRGDLKKHERTHTGEKPFSCEICKYKSAHKHNLLNHMKTHTGEKPFSCDICNYKSSDRFNLLRHMKRKSHAHAS